MPEELQNVAFKVTWVYGEDGPWTTPCTPEGRRISIRREGKQSRAHGVPRGEVEFSGNAGGSS
jgi:hypothetical protein